MQVKRTVKPVNYAERSTRYFRDKEIEIKRENILWMQAAIYNFNLQLTDQVVDLTEEEILENINILVDVDDNDVHTYY